MQTPEELEAARRSVANLEPTARVRVRILDRWHGQAARSSGPKLYVAGDIIEIEARQFGPKVMERVTGDTKARG
jgi:hypothetical protein